MHDECVDRRVVSGEVAADVRHPLADRCALYRIGVEVACDGFVGKNIWSFLTQESGAEFVAGVGAVFVDFELDH